MDMAMTTVEAAELGKARRIDDAAGRCIEFCKGTVSGDLSLKGIRIVVDCANGATYHIAPKVFRELGASVIEIGSSPDGININEGCGATSTLLLEQTVLEKKADLGIALDGDGDRLIMVDHKGEQVDGDELLYIIAMALQAKGQLKGGVVGTLMSNFGLEQGLKQAEIPFIRAQVGDRYVLEQLIANDWLLGGESSGHLVCRQLTSTGDGIVAALQVLKAMADDKASLYELKSAMHKMPQTMINVHLSSKVDVLAFPAVQDAVADIESRLGDRGRVLLRPSGTEPVVRVMVEGDDEVWVEGLCQELAQAVQQAL
jgi:phosphoglucosamine mutase